MDMPLVKAAYEREGYVIVPGLVPPSDATIRGLFDAAGIAASLTHAGIWPHRRTVGKQFPPYDDANPDSWGVQHLLHPDLPVDNRAVFMQWYVSDALIGVVKTLLECKEEDLQMELFNMLINPKSHNFALRWHRDDIKESATEEEERHALSIPHYGVQWNTALYDDSCLYVVPKSHIHPRTDEQRKYSSTPNPPNDPLDMPGAIQVHLKKGETIFYNSNILHCATYSSNSPRRTLHGCIGDARGGSKRARNVLQHGLEWMKDDKFVNTLPEGRARNMWQRLMEMERGTSGGRQYSLEG